MTNPIVPSITDEELDEIYQCAVDGGQCNDVNTLLLIARLRAAEKDAARYRWLRDSDWYVGPDTVEADEGGCRLLGYANENSAAEDLDKAIDTAMEQSK